MYFILIILIWSDGFDIFLTPAFGIYLLYIQQAFVLKLLDKLQKIELKTASGGTSLLSDKTSRGERIIQAVGKGEAFKTSAA